MINVNKLLILKSIFLIALFQLNAVCSSVAPILDIDNEAVGYLGTIGERNVLVDLKPHLQIRNIDAINGICSYHVFKPNSEEFPFTIDIKDKLTGEAVIEVVRKDDAQTTPTTAVFDHNNERSNPKSIVLDCNKRKEFNFLIQAHDCSTPSLPSNKVPVKIEIIDHDDYVPKFEQDVYKKTLAESDEIYENFMSIRAKDNDCTNEGYACSYTLLLNDFNNVDANFAFKIDSTGSLSSTKAVKKGEIYEFKIRAFDCLNKESYVDTQAVIEVVEPCVPQFTDYQSELASAGESTSLFDSIKASSCDDSNQNVFMKKEATCDINGVSLTAKLTLDSSIQNNCQVEKCNADVESSKKFTTTRVSLFSGGANKEDYEDDDSIEDDDESSDENKIVPSSSLKPDDVKQKQPMNYRTFSKVVENAQKIDFDGKFGDEFTLSSWLRRQPNADKTVKEQVLCGTDSLSMNRHHFGLYFYKDNLKFLLRKEPTHKRDSDAAQSEVFYPSLWEWKLYEPLISDAKWHYYEIKFSYPNATLYVDGVKFAENATNSDIVDAYELNDVNNVGAVSSYIGACYHARTKSLLDHFEGDIGSVVLVKKQKVQEEEKKPQVQAKCKQTCSEYIELNMVGNENYIQSIETLSPTEILFKTSNLNDMVQLVRKIQYVNKLSNPKPGSRQIALTPSIQCENNGKTIPLKEASVKLVIRGEKQEYNVQLEGAKQLFATKVELENGIEPFKDISILKIPINKIDDTPNAYDVNKSSDDSSTEEDSSSSVESAESDGLDSSSDQAIKLSKCLIKIAPERNLMAKSSNSEKVMFLQNLLDEFGFKFEETLDSVTISGMQSVENYQTFIRRLTYVITNINEVDQNNLVLIKNKQFYISCLRNEPNIETNTILVQLNLTKSELAEGSQPDGFVAHKQAQKYVVSENDEDILQKKVDDFPFSTNGKKATSPIVVAVVVMCSCAIGFILVFGAIKLHNARVLSSRRKNLPNEENPQMEWDDSGLNITENPLESLEAGKDPSLNPSQNIHSTYGHYEFDGSEYTSSEEEGDDDEEDSNDDEYNVEEPEKVIDRELEWDDTSLEIKIKDKQLKQQEILESSNKLASAYVDPNKFV